MPDDALPWKDEIGARYGLLTVTAEAPWYQPPSGGRYRRWWCRCDCGQETIARHSDLRRKACR